MQKEMIEGYRLSSQQKQLWLMQQDGGAHPVQCALLLEGPCETGLLRESLYAVARRHEILRTTFERLPGVDVPIQVIQAEPQISWREVEPNESASPAFETQIEQTLREDAALAFDFEQEPLV